MDGEAPRRGRHGLDVRLGDDAARRRDARTLRRPLRDARRVGPPDAEDPRVVRGRGRDPRPRGHRRRRGRRRPPARHARRADGRAGPRRARREPGAQGSRLPPLDRTDAGRRARGHARDREGGRDERGSPRRRDRLERPARSPEEAQCLPVRTDPEGLAVPAPVNVIPPGSTVGVLGSGQLGRMFALAARAMGYRVHTYSPEEDSPTGHVADVEVSAAYEDLDRLRDFAKAIDVLTFEFENVPRHALDTVAEIVPIRPGAEALWVSQNREREKDFLREVNVPVAPWAVVHTSDGLATALSSVGAPAVLKTAAFGYDGKGQARVHSKNLPEAETAWATLGRVPCVFESFVEFQREISVIAARGADGNVAFFPAFENEHRRHILD